MLLFSASNFCIACNLLDNMLQELLTRHKATVAAFLSTNFDWVSMSFDTVMFTSFPDIWIGWVEFNKKYATMVDFFTFMICYMTIYNTKIGIWNINYVRMFATSSVGFEDTRTYISILNTLLGIIYQYFMSWAWKLCLLCGKLLVVWVKTSKILILSCLGHLHWIYRSA